MINPYAIKATIKKAEFIQLARNVRIGFCSLGFAAQNAIKAFQEFERTLKKLDKDKKKKG